MSMLLKILNGITGIPDNNHVGQIIRSLKAPAVIVEFSSRQYQGINLDVMQLSR